VEQPRTGTVRLGMSDASPARRLGGVVQRFTKTIVRRGTPAWRHTLPGSMHSVVQRVLLARNVTSTEDLGRSLAELHPYSRLHGMPEAVDLLHTVLQSGGRILIVADFDADGATSCAVAVRALRLMGAGDVRYLVPNRFDFGYGLTPELVEVAARSRPDLVVTVDNGISSIEGVQAARRLGMRVLVTDHHLPGAMLPGADAIVNPNLAGDTFPSKCLAGVGVVFYVMLALRARLRESGWFGRTRVPEPNLAQLLDLVALGTVADVVPLDRNNRILVRQGLARMRSGRCSAGIEALAKVAARPLSRITAQDLGFALAPRLNAAGRLEDMSCGIACLLSDDGDEALALAARLDELNRERRAIEGQMHEQALRQISGQAWQGLLGVSTDDSIDGREGFPFGVCLFDPEWHQGVIGILAGRIRERVHRPVIAFALAASGELKGSARSVPGMNIRDALAAVAARNPGLIRKFGGHAMAAGLSLSRDLFDDFSAEFDAEVRRHLNAHDLQGVVYSDGELHSGELTLDLAEALRAAGPWGQGFPEPIFDGVFSVVDARMLVDRHLKLTLRCANDARVVHAIAFNTPGEPWLGKERSAGSERSRSVRIAYKLDVNEYQGTNSLQLLIEHIEAADELAGAT
jgi:single-stranded-DNA-specific exonuclease